MGGLTEQGLLNGTSSLYLSGLPIENIVSKKFLINFVNIDPFINMFLTKVLNMVTNTF